MTIKEIKKELKRNGYIWNFEVYDEDDIICIYAYGSTDPREVLSIEIEYKDKEEKQEIMDKVKKLIERFNFSFHLSFETLEELELFVN